MIGAGPIRTIEKSLIIKKIKRLHRRAQSTGLIYLVGTIAILALALVMPIFEVALPVRVGGATELDVFTVSLTGVFSAFSIETFNTASALKLMIAVLYLLMLFSVVMSIFRCLLKLGRLFKMKVTWVVSEETFNENVEAMERLGRVFSGAFAFAVTMLTMIYLVGGADNVSVQIGVYAILSVCIFIYFCGACLSRLTARFYPDEKEKDWPFWPRQQVDKTSSWVAFVRNMMRIVLVFTALGLFTQICGLHQFIMEFLTAPNMNAFMSDTNNIISLVLDVLLGLFLITEVHMATSQKEYYMAAFIFSSERLDGWKYSGIKAFLTVSIFTLIFTIAWVGAHIALGLTLSDAQSIMAIVLVFINLAACLIPVFMSAMEKEAAKKIKLTEMGTVFNNYGNGYSEML